MSDAPALEQKKRGLNAARATAFGTISAAGAVWLAALVLGGEGFALDLQLFQLLYTGNDMDIANNARRLTFLGSAIFLIPVAVVSTIVLIFTRRIRAALFLVIVFGGRLLVELQKVIVDRDRPGLSPHLESVHSMSFPSGHAANAMITYLAIALLLPARQLPRAIAIGIGLALAVQAGWTRVALGIHWPTDVIGGWAFGILWITICMYLARARPEAES